MGVRVYELARELGMPSKELLEYLQTQGLKAKSHMASVDERVAQILRDRLPRTRPKKPAPKPAPKPAAAPVAAAKGGAKSAPATSPDRGATAPQRNGGGAGEAKKAPTAEDSRGRDTRRASSSPSSAGSSAKGSGNNDPRAKEKEKEKPTRRRYFPGVGDASFSGPRKGPGPRKPRRRDAPTARTPMARPASTQAKVSEVSLQLPVTVKEFSAKVGLKVPDIMKGLMKRGHMVSMNAYVDEDLLAELGKEFEIEITLKKEETTEDAILALEARASEPDQLDPRAPIVTFLGHVDHGKTSLLDYIRKTKVTAKEHGGITQHLGAYRVDSGKVHVVFIDTPGHQAFTEMRSRGANITDVAVLVVAADEGVMPQTEEACNHAKAASVPIIVALNKIDKPNANPQRCLEQLSRMDLQPVAWGGQTEVIEVSAQTGAGVDSLLETLSLESEILELKANSDLPAIGTVLEAESNPGRGNLATMLIKDGTLKIGDYILAGHAHGKIRNMWLNGTTPIGESGPATPVQVSGLNAIPDAGDRFYVFEDVQKARQIAEERYSHRRDRDRARNQMVSLESIFERLDDEDKELRLVLKADVKGTLQALDSTLEQLGTEEVRVRIIHSGVGAVGQDDVTLADASGAVVLAFNVPVDERARSSADEKQVEVRQYKVIYEAVDDVRLALADKLSPILKEVNQGTVEIRQIYKASKIGNIAGCFVTKGSIFRDSKIRLHRGSAILHTGKLESLKRFKDDIREAKEGYECGLRIAGFEDIREGDTVEAFEIVKEKRTLES